MRKLSNNTSGQALLLVLLSMAVVLTIVLSILARSTVDIGISSRSEESVRAFSAAEAGIEQALVAGSFWPSGKSGDVPIGDATFNAGVTDFSSGVEEFVLPSSFYSGESGTVWFVSHDDDNNLICDGEHQCFTGRYLQVCWGKENTPDNTANTPAIEVSIIYLTSPGVYTTARIAREVVDPNDTRRSSNNFSEDGGGDCMVDNQSFAFNKTIDFGVGGLKILPASIYIQPNGLQLARISFLYNTDMRHPVAINTDFVGNSTLPAQGVIIESSGVSGSSTRKVEVVRGFRELPGIFETAVFSQGDITK